MPSGWSGKEGFLEERTFQLSPEKLRGGGRASKGTKWRAGREKKKEVLQGRERSMCDWLGTNDRAAA